MCYRFTAAAHFSLLTRSKYNFLASLEEFEEASVPASFDQLLTKLPADDSGVRMLLVLSQFAIKQSNPDS